MGGVLSAVSSLCTANRSYNANSAGEAPLSGQSTANQSDLGVLNVWSAMTETVTSMWDGRGSGELKFRVPSETAHADVVFGDNAREVVRSLRSNPDGHPLSDPKFLGRTVVIEEKTSGAIGNGPDSFRLRGMAALNGAGPKRADLRVSFSPPSSAPPSSRRRAQQEGGPVAERTVPAAPAVPPPLAPPMQPFFAWQDAKPNGDGAVLNNGLSGDLLGQIPPGVLRDSANFLSPGAPDDPSATPAPPPRRQPKQRPGPLSVDTSPLSSGKLKRLRTGLTSAVRRGSMSAASSGRSSPIPVSLRRMSTDIGHVSPTLSPAHKIRQWGSNVAAKVKRKKDGGDTPDTLDPREREQSADTTERLDVTADVSRAGSAFVSAAHSPATSVSPSPSSRGPSPGASPRLIQMLDISFSDLNEASNLPKSKSGSNTGSFVDPPARGGDSARTLGVDSPVNKVNKTQPPSAQSNPEQPGSLWNAFAQTPKTPGSPSTPESAWSAPKTEPPTPASAMSPQFSADVSPPKSSKSFRGLDMVKRWGSSLVSPRSKNSSADDKSEAPQSTGSSNGGKPKPRMTRKGTPTLRGVGPPPAGPATLAPSSSTRSAKLNSRTSKTPEANSPDRMSPRVSVDISP
eukprot:CAMPEP_0114540778 /NCGR_PEP_ID=MMETSP0114-20121206/955_1 /TAXON_ID=31324 /ORGANISM="Goniomonas sp, Strain m" /LENGTH=625 /DNA_ID=CAMNT_0001724975 /DNA_START=1 /DNA_END=1874 /DNA_ORIENTATION=+